MRSRKESNQEGRLIVELVLTIPFLLVLFLVASELSRFARNKQALTVVVGEIGEAISRNCVSFWELDADGNGFDMTNTKIRTAMCIRDMTNQIGFAQFTNGLLPFLRVGSIDVAISVIGPDPSTGGGVVLFGSSTTSSPITDPMTPPQMAPWSKFSIVGGGISGPYPVSAPLLAARGRVVIIEGRFDFNAIFSGRFGFNFLTDGGAYDAAVF